MEGIVEIVKVALALVRDSDRVRGKACSPGAMFERAMVPGVVGENAAHRIPRQRERRRDRLGGKRFPAVGDPGRCG